MHMGLTAKLLRGSWRALALVMLAAALTNCGEGGGAPPPLSISNNAPLPTPPTNYVPPPGSIYLGAYVNPSQQPDPPPTLIAGLEQQIGRRFALGLHYYGFYQNFPGPDDYDDVANGRIPVDSWNCTPSNATIAAGNADQAIKARADAIKAFGHVIFLRYMYEMELASTTRWRPFCYDPNTDLPNGVFSPQYFIAAWKRIRAIFAQEGATNVIWLWNPAGEKNLGEYYPGASEVDWVGLDRYDTGDLTPTDTFSAAYSLLQGLGKPIMIGETGAQLASQNEFFTDLPSTLSTQFPLVKAVNYFDSSRKDNYFAGYSWVLDPATMSAFTTMANSPYMTAYEP
jgi:hypothetical protein